MKVGTLFIGKLAGKTYAVYEILYAGNKMVIGTAKIVFVGTKQQAENYLKECENGEETLN